jgi:tetratricopeptide (TPR) repeat protein
MARKATGSRPGRSSPTPARARVQAGAGITLPAAAALLALVCILAYWNSFRAELLLDNQTIILKDTRLRMMEWRAVWDIFRFPYWWPSFETDLFRPITTLSYWFNFSVLGNGESPFGYHAVNLLLHWSNALLVFSLVRTVTGRPWVSLFTAAVFVSHPLTVESVTNVVGRADLLAGMSVVGGLCLYRRFLMAAGRRRLAWLAALAATYLAGVFCKESAVVLPGLMLLHDVAFPPADAANRLATVRRSLSRVWPAYLGTLPGLVALLWARWALFHDSPRFGQFASDNPIAIAPLWTGVMTAVKVAGYYLALMFWPATLSCDYSYNQITLFGWTVASGQDAHAWIALAVLVGLLIAAAIAWHRHRGIVFFLGLAAVTFLPTSNLLFPTGTIMAERLMYLPLVGMTAAAALAIAAGGQLVLTRLSDSSARRMAIGLKVLAVVAIAALIGRTVARNEDWTSSVRLWSAAAQATPDSIKVQRGLALSIMDSDPSGGRVDEALEVASRGLRILEQAPLPLHHMPAALFVDLAHYHARRADRLAAGGQNAEALVERGVTLSLLQRADQIDREINRQGRESQLRRGMTPEQIHDTGTPIVYRNLASAYLGVGDPEQAVATLIYLQHIQPASDDAHYTRGVAEGATASLEQTRGNGKQVREHLELAAVSLIEAILLNPGNDAAWQALARAYQIMAPSTEGVVVVGGKPTLNMDHPLTPDLLRRACVQLVRQLAEGGFPDDAARWREQAINQLGVPSGSFAPPRAGGDQR